MYSISKYHQWGASLGFDTADLSGSLGGNLRNGERHIIEEITTLLGHNSAMVIVAKALELNGAMIASAQRNPDGTFTDHGQLTLNFGEIFLKHLHGYDDGITLGAAINLKGHLQDDNFVKRFTFGMHKEEQTVYATVGQGPGDIPGANRDVNQAMKNRVKVNIDPINAYFSNYDFAAAHQEIAQEIKQGGARFILRTAEGIFNTVIDPLFELYYKFTKPVPTPEPEFEPEFEVNEVEDEEEDKDYLDPDGIEDVAEVNNEEKPEKNFKQKSEQKLKKEVKPKQNKKDLPEIEKEKLIKEIIRQEMITAMREIDKLPISIEEKMEMSLGIYEYLQEQAKNPEGVRLENAHAAAGAAPAIACLSNIFCATLAAAAGAAMAYKMQSAKSYGAREEFPAEKRKPSIFSTPKEDAKPEVFSTPAEEQEPQILWTPEGGYKFVLPGFEIHSSENLNILYKDGDTGEYNSEYWPRYIEFKGSRVYQRDDLIDPNRIDEKTGLTNLELMQKNRSPIGPDGQPIHIHHLTQNAKGGMAEVTQTMHQKYTKILHINPNSFGSGINRGEFNKWREEYWGNRAKKFEKGD